MTPDDGGIAKGAGLMNVAKGWKWLHNYINEKCERTAARMRIMRTLDCTWEETIRLEAMARMAASMNTRSSEEVFEAIIRHWERMGKRADEWEAEKDNVDQRSVPPGVFEESSDLDCEAGS